MNNKLWWGYLHTSGTIQTKPYYSKLDTDEAEQSPFCKKVIYPFEAIGRDEAIKYITEQIEIEREDDSHMLFHECPLCNCRCNCTDLPCSCCNTNN